MELLALVLGGLQLQLRVAKIGFERVELLLFRGEFRFETGELGAKRGPVIERSLLSRVVSNQCVEFLDLV